MEAEKNENGELPEFAGEGEPALECLAVSVPIAGASIDLGRSASYEAAKRGDIPTVRIGGRLLVPLRKFRQKFQ